MANVARRMRLPAERQASLRRLAKAAALGLPPVRRVVDQRDDLLGQVERLQRQNARLREARRTRDDLGFLFIVTYGRSGSTLLQGILSTIPGYLIRGENGGVAYQLFKFHAMASKQKIAKSAGSRSPQSAWFGIGDYPKDAALREIRHLVLSTLIRPEPDSRVVGFKEIKWLQDDLHAYVDFLREAFPGARFVVNTRNLDDVVVSKWWAQDPNARETLAQAESRMLELTERLGPDAYHIHYDDYVQNPARLRGLFDWLGEEFDEARVTAAMAQRHSY